jgi:hypothetical protein
MRGSVLFGVVGGSADDALVGYLKEPLAPTPDVLARAGPLEPTAVFRFAAPCAESACAHFDGADCRLAAKVVDLLPPVVAVLPPCSVRRGVPVVAAGGTSGVPAVPDDRHRDVEPLRRVAPGGGPGGAGPGLTRGPGLGQAPIGTLRTWPGKIRSGSVIWLGLARTMRGNSLPFP